MYIHQGLASKCYRIFPNFQLVLYAGKYKFKSKDLSSRQGLRQRAEINLVSWAYITHCCLVTKDLAAYFFDLFFSFEVSKYVSSVHRYAKVYLLPDKTKGGKKKTKTRKNTLNPDFDEILTVNM